MVFNKGINDLTSDLPSYTCWHSMLRRCYSSVYQHRKPTYVGISVSDDWLLYSNFNNWYNKNYVEGWHLDKDLLIYGNKLYSKDNCVFLPNIINSALTEKSESNSLPPGVYYKRSHQKYVSQISIMDGEKRRTKHLIIHDDPMVCFEAYREAKSLYIKNLADRYKDKLDARAYLSLTNFKVKYNE